MIADPLTKAMSCDRLSRTLSTGVLDLKPTEESLYIKEKNKVIRKKAREAKKSLRTGSKAQEPGSPEAPEEDKELSNTEANVAETTSAAEMSEGDDTEDELRKERIAEQEREIPEEKPTGTKKPGYHKLRKWITFQDTHGITTFQ